MEKIEVNSIDIDEFVWLVNTFYELDSNFRFIHSEIFNSLDMPYSVYNINGMFLYEWQEIKVKKVICHEIEFDAEIILQQLCRYRRIVPGLYMIKKEII